jgi:hypothetical protein
MFNTKLLRSSSREYLRQGNSATEGNGKAENVTVPKQCTVQLWGGEEIRFSASVILAADERENWFHTPAALLLGEHLFVPEEHKADKGEVEPLAEKKFPTQTRNPLAM